MSDIRETIMVTVTLTREYNPENDEPTRDWDLKADLEYTLTDWGFEVFDLEVKGEWENVND